MEANQKIYEKEDIYIYIFIYLFIYFYNEKVFKF